MQRATYTLHLYIPIIIWFIFGILVIINTDPATPVSVFDYILMIGQYIWITPIIYAVSNFIGLIKGVQDITKIYPPSRKKYTILWVSRGQNVQALYKAIKNSIKAKPKFYNPNLCVVTDIEIESQYRIKDVQYLVVPKDYITTNKVKYKARALEYARQYIDTDYTLHLDEESTMTTGLYLGVNEFISTNTNTIGQGIILYNSDIEEYKYNLESKIIPIEMIDAVRTGDDLGRFRFQYQNIHKPIFGMHGSFMLIPKVVSDDITWDLKGNSITEDAEFSLRATEKNYKFGFVNGYLKEQSPHTINDLIKQRKRWFSGISTVILDRSISIKSKYILAIMLFNWSISWIIPIVTVVTIVTGKSFLPTILILPVSLITGISFAIYYIGLYANLKPKFTPSTIKIYINMFLLLILQIIPIIEGIGIIRALLSPPKTFEVITKK